MPRLTRRNALALLSSGTVAAFGALPTRARATDSRPHEESGYQLKYSGPVEALIGDLLHGERGNPRRQSELPYADWYSPDTRRRFHGWGPKPRQYPPLEGLAAQPVEWKRERVIATAERFLGYGYQHHHIPDWDPPQEWPWTETCVGHNGKGFDCSNFTSFIYNQGFGIKVSSAITRQSTIDHGFSNGRPVRAQRIPLPESYAARVAALRTGDLLFIRGREDGHVTHVVLWVGDVGRAESGVPLVLDSHGGGVKDDGGRPIPCGVHLRPYRESSWYNHCASHAHRIFA